MKIIFCLNHFLPQQVAGTEIYTSSLIRELQTHKTECLVLIPNYGETQDKTYWIDGIRVIQYAEPSVIDRSLNMGRRPPEGLDSYLRILQSEQPDVIHFQEVAGGNGMTMFHLKAAKSTGAKLIITFHLAGYSCRTGDLMFRQKELCNGLIDEERCMVCYLQHRGYEKIGAPLAAVSGMLYKAGVNTSFMSNRVGTSLSFPFIINDLRKTLHEIATICDKVVLLTRWYYDILLKNGIAAEKLEIITQGLPLKDTAVEDPRSVNDKPLRLIFIGRISPLKGLHLLIDAMKLIDCRRVSLHIYGSSTDQQYEKQCKISSVSMPNIKWMGQLGQVDVIPTIQRYHALVLPSTFSEMSPLVIQEAFAAGIPVIASNTYGNAEQVTDGLNGLLFAFNDAEALSQSILQLADKPDLLSRLRKGIDIPKSFGQIGNEYYQLYQHLLTEVPVSSGK